MGPPTAWATGFLTQLILRHLRKHYPTQTADINPRLFFSAVEGNELLRNPHALLTDSHAYIPEEVLREVLSVAERITGQKDVAYHAALEYFDQSGNGGHEHAPSIFEIIALSISDVRSVALCSNLWAGAYTTFLRLQPLMKDSSASELVILSQCPNNFCPLISMHYMLKGNYEGFVRLYDFVEEACLQEEFLQYRVRDIVSEFDNYRVEGFRQSTVIKNRTGKTIVEFTPVRLESEEISLVPPNYQRLSKVGAELTGAILHPENKGSKPPAYRVLTSRPSKSSGASKEFHALKVTRGGRLQSGPLTFTFSEGAIFDAPYSRYRFHWREKNRPVLGKHELENRFQLMTQLLFNHLRDVKAVQQRLLAYAVENKALTTENIYLRREVDSDWASQKILGESPSLVSIMGLVGQIAPTDSTVLITGETGTGKEVIARLIHAKSPRVKGRFVALNCAAVSEGLLESELFGHEKGAFSGAVGRRLGRFELAHGGTLFLDEIGDVSPAMQVKLLRVLQEKSFERVGGERTIDANVRVIAATNQNLQELVSKGQFRIDLYYRLNVIPICIAPLRERLDDIQPLSEFFLKRHSTKLRKQLSKISSDALLGLKAYAWPGNIRELENIIERIVTLSPAGESLLTVEMLPGELRRSPENGDQGDTMDEWVDKLGWDQITDLVSSEGSMGNVLRKIEWSLAKRAIRVYGNKSQAARALKRTYRWIRKLEKQMDGSSTLDQ